MTLMVLLVVVALLVALELLGRVLQNGLDEPLWWHDLMTQRKEVQLRRLSRRGGADVVVIGSSLVLLGVDPDALAARTGLTVYNASIYRGLPRLSEAWLRDRVLPLLKPRWVLVGLCVEELNDNMPLKQQYDLYRTSRALRAGPLARAWRRVGLLSAGARYAPVLVRPRTLAKGLTTAWGRRGAWRWAAPSDVPGKLGPTGGGIDYLDRSYHNTAKMTELYAAVAGNYEDRGDELGALLRIIELNRSYGARTAFLDMPASREFVIEMHEGGAASWSSLEEDLHAKVRATGTPIIAVADGLESVENFADYMHMNRRGRDTFSERVASALVEIMTAEDAKEVAR